MSLEPIDSRRLTGPNLLWDLPGAVLDIQHADAAALEELMAFWESQARALLDDVGWGTEQTCTLRHRDAEGRIAGCSLAISAPMDGLYAATEINEAAWRLATATHASEAPSGDELAELRSELRRAVGRERDDDLRALQAAAAEHGVRIISDDEHVSLGAGKGSLTWECNGPFAEHEGPVTRPIPAPHDVAWNELHDIPIVLVTGTNGKTTTTRLLSAMVEDAGLTPGQSSTDGVWVGGQLVDSGDYSGPGGARLVLRHPDVDVALLETARGGMLRRGLGVRAADVALITNVAEDHLGEFGIADLAGLARVKAIVARATDHLVLNWDDPELRQIGVRLSREGTHQVEWFSVEASPVDLARETLTTVAGVEGGRLCVVADALQQDFGEVKGMPLLFGGAAHYNVANALAAVLAARQLGLPQSAIASALQRFGSKPSDNPGRGNTFVFGAARIVADFAHNPHGVAAALDLVRRLEPKRLLVVIGQAGDRDDASILGLSQTVAQSQADHVLIKELDEYRRGRPSGEVARMLREELEANGLEGEQIERVADETAALERLQQILQPGDIVLFTVHSNREETLARLQQLQDEGWQPRG